MNEKKGGAGTVIISIIVIFIFFGMIGSCSGSSDSSFSDTLKSGEEKYWNNEPMTKQEHDTVESYHKWQDKQGEKSYDEW